MTEGVIDTLNVQWRNILGQPLNATVGRQDILLGDGWLVGDGTPQDGSWTYFLDSARVTYELKEQHTTFEAIGIMQDATGYRLASPHQLYGPVPDRTKRKGRDLQRRQHLAAREFR